VIEFCFKGDFVLRSRLGKGRGLEDNKKKRAEQRKIQLVHFVSFSI
jgi:hypothetical protein